MKCYALRTKEKQAGLFKSAEYHWVNFHKPQLTVFLPECITFNRETAERCLTHDLVLVTMKLTIEDEV